MKIVDQQKEIKYYHEKIREYIRRNTSQLPSALTQELEKIMKKVWTRGQESLSDRKGNVSDYDANLQLQQIVEEQERYKKLIYSMTRNQIRFRSAMKSSTGSNSRNNNATFDTKSIRKNSTIIRTGNTNIEDDANVNQTQTTLTS